MKSLKMDLVVLGAGPGGYAGAFYAADLGKKVILVEQDKRPGGVCLNRGCIPSKALLNATSLMREARESAGRGISFQKPKVELGKLRACKESILEKLAAGIMGLAKKRGVEGIHGKGHFEGSQTLRVETAEGQQLIEYEKLILAVGSKPSMPAVFDLGNRRVMTSTEALELEEIPQSVLVIGGGYIGMELGTVYATLGSRVSLVEALDQILTGVDPDLTRPVMKFAESHFQSVRLSTKITKMRTSGTRVAVTMETGGVEKKETYDRVLVSVGRVPNVEDLGLENTKVQSDERGFVKVNEKQETADPAIYAIGDVAGGVMLAHKASREARVAVEVITGQPSSSANVVIPAVVFTDPEIAWCGLTETEARKQNRPVQTVRFPLAASGRALTLDRTDGVTKLVIDPVTERVLGVGMTGHGAGELISEGVLAVEMGATARDIAASVHPHPTLSETLMECAELFYGHATHALSPRPRQS